MSFSQSVESCLSPETTIDEFTESEPQWVSKDHVKHLLEFCRSIEASDITIQTDQQPRAEIKGRLVRVGRKRWTPVEVEIALFELYGASNAVAEIRSRRILDFAYQMHGPNRSRLRYRVNATAIHGLDGTAIEISVRILPASTPTAKSVALTCREVTALAPEAGLVIVAGPTGGGKSTTLAALIRHHLECQNRPRKIVDIESPIEYTFQDITMFRGGSNSLVGQSEVGRHIPSFASGVHSALRRNPDIIVIGELRDSETARSVLEAGVTGHLVYSTTHAGSVGECVRRILSIFPSDESRLRACDLIAALRFVMVQRLVPMRNNSGRIAVREYLEFTPAFSSALLDANPNSWPAMISARIREGDNCGDDRDSLAQSFEGHVRKLLGSSKISRTTARRIAGSELTALRNADA